MKYISGIYALNIPCSLDTTGDWHRSSLPWKEVELKDSEESPLKGLGIEKDVYIRELGRSFNVANTLRACVDFLDEGKYLSASGMRRDYICNDKYDRTLFEMVYALKPYKTEEQWNRIRKIMEKDYMLKWIGFEKEKEDQGGES